MPHRHSVANPSQHPLPAQLYPPTHFSLPTCASPHLHAGGLPPKRTRSAAASSGAVAMLAATFIGGLSGALGWGLQAAQRNGTSDELIQPLRQRLLPTLAVMHRQWSQYRAGSRYGHDQQLGSNGALHGARRPARTWLGIACACPWPALRQHQTCHSTSQINPLIGPLLSHCALIGPLLSHCALIGPLLSHCALMPQLPQR
jgi:hypothetical protein